MPNQKFDNATEPIVKAIQVLSDNVASVSHQIQRISQNGEFWTPAAKMSLALLLITVVGWVVAYIYGVRIQRKRFYFDVINEARQDMASAITEYQDWLTQTELIANGLEQNISYMSMSETRLRDWYVRVSEKEHDVLKCCHVAEEYKRIFPDVFELIKDMQDRHYINIATFRTMAHFIMKPPIYMRQEQFNDAKNYVADNINSMQDTLPRYVYNLQQIKVYINESVFIIIFGRRGEYQIRYDSVGISVSEDDKGKKFDLVFKD